MSSDPNAFCKIVAGRKIPSRKVYEDDELLACRHDIAPWAPVHRAHHPQAPHRLDG